MNTLYSSDFVGAGAAPALPNAGHAAALAALNQELERLVQQGLELEGACQAILDLAARRLRAEFAGIFRLGHEGRVEAVSTRGQVVSPHGDFRPDDLQEMVQTCLDRPAPMGRVLSPRSGHAGIAVPCRGPGAPTVILLVLLRIQEFDMTTAAMMAGTLGAAIAQMALADRIRRSECEGRAAAAAVELVSRLQLTGSLREAAYLLVNELQAYFACQQLVLALTNRGGPGVNVTAISGLKEFDPNAESTRLLRAALDETMVREAMTAWPPLSSQERHSTLAHRALADHARAEAILSVPLLSIDGRSVGALLAIGTSTVLHAPAQRQLWEAMRPHLATCLEFRRRTEPGLLARLGSRMGQTLTSPETRWLPWVVIAAGLLLALLPLPHRISTRCRVEPVVRRFVVAPHEGRLAECLAAPGDEVVEGQVLARMDDRELRLELSGLMAERGRAAKERDTHRVDHDTSAAQIAQLEVERLDVQVHLLKERAKNLEITSPIAGVILRGDLEDAEGAPVAVGQTLFEVAPLDTVRLELAILEDDVAWVRAPCTVRARLEGRPGPTIVGTVERVHPRGEIRDQKNVFVAEAPLPNPRRDLRPGMSGRARIATGYRPAGWLWGHKAWYRLRMILGW